MGQIDVNNVLSQMRQLGAQASFPTSAAAPSIGAAQGSDFGSLLKQSLAAVADTATGGISSLITQSLSAVAGAQNDAQTKVDAFERGDAGSDIGSTVIAGQKADLAFRSLVQVRNKLTDAYSTIMNMPV
ncbi:flagellar hook-basal body complex protein FliE [Rhodanobacter sp. MP7CTX1]|uniref:flagellar hook-basal body complex protein FliE n=1 Tax=Rhodanobacter sp. MP7CTX1 TaxID=2723084 RepID=UPI001616E6FE|nr:flagellar hook-basal body complex protein FliE [Rhodanobacter sp. MP7CTX1]MBB6186252.1 flagellar hook-basal body complex protein FliE [Rhodanobacter sp. MP7CTX1]